MDWPTCRGVLIELLEELPEIDAVTREPMLSDPRITGVTALLPPPARRVDREHMGECWLLIDAVIMLATPARSAEGTVLDAADLIDAAGNAVLEMLYGNLSLGGTAITTSDYGVEAVQITTFVEGGTEWLTAKVNVTVSIPTDWEPGA